MTPPFTAAQRTTLKTFVTGDSTLMGFINTGHPELAANSLNANASPDYFVWRTTVSVLEIMSNGFDWVRVDNMTVGKARIWEFMTSVGNLFPSQTNVRAGINEAFSGAANDAMRLAIFGHCQRKASVVEKVLATGGGATTSNAGVGPSTMGSEGPISVAELEQALIEG